MTIKYLFLLLLSSSLFGTTELDPCPLIKTVGLRRYRLSEIFERVKLDRFRNPEVERYPVVVEPLPRIPFYKEFVVRKFPRKEVVIEFVNFENEVGIQPAFKNWMEKNRTPYDGDRFTSLTPEQLKAAQQEIERMNATGFERARKYRDEYGEFILKHEKRRGWSQKFYDVLADISKYFQGSATFIGVRDKATGNLVATMQVIRAPYGGVDIVETDRSKLIVDTKIGSWGPSYRQTVMTSPGEALMNDSILFLNSQAIGKAEGGDFTTILKWEKYVPEIHRLDRRNFRSGYYATSRMGKGFSLWWEHELVELSGFAVDPEFAQRHQAYRDIVEGWLVLVLDPFYSRMTNYHGRTYTFPNDLKGARLFRHLGFKPYGEKFELFDMPDWQMQVASGEEFIEGSLKTLENLADKAYAEDFHRKLLDLYTP